MKVAQSLTIPPLVIAATQRAIQHWLNDRKDLLVSFHHLCNLRPFVTTEVHLSDAVQDFCQRLVDYLSAGHFSLFEPIARTSELFGSHISDTRRILLQLEQSTASILKFNDKYQVLNEVKGLEEDLSLLGEQLADRLIQEDRLLTIYKAIHEAEIKYARSA